VCTFFSETVFGSLFSSDVVVNCSDVQLFDVCGVDERLKLVYDDNG